MSSTPTVVASPQSTAVPTPKPGTRPRRRTTELPEQECRGDKLMGELNTYISKHKGQFIRDDEGKLFVLFENRKIPLADSPDNFALKDLLLSACNITLISTEARIAVERLRILANRTCRPFRSRSFSACSGDGKRIYLPVSNEKLLQLTAETVKIVSNGLNDDDFWIAHPKNDAFQYDESDHQRGLADFERLLVENLSCVRPAMRWFVAMHEGILPFVRDLVTARILVIHQGPSQQGKTTGAQRFTLFLGLGEVLGDATLASIQNAPDSGLLVLDNKEQANFSQSLIDYCLFLSTGAARARSNSDGSAVRETNKSRPVGVVTCIEGVFKGELLARCVPVEFAINGEKTVREEIEPEITRLRHSMSSALVPVLQSFLRIRSEHRTTPKSRPGFDAHFDALCDLLRAYGEVAERPVEWAEDLIAQWDRFIRVEQHEDEENELEYPIVQTLTTDKLFFARAVQFQGREGKLVRVECAQLFEKLYEKAHLRGLLPKVPSGLGRRIRGGKFKSFVVVSEKEFPELKRTAASRPIGFFVPNDGNDRS